MKSITEIQEAIHTLSPEDFAAFRAWFTDFDAELWDRQIEEDAVAGRLDALIREALRDYRKRLTEDLDPDRL